MASVDEADNATYIKTEQLTIGIYVYLDLDWMSHPFSFSSFKIKQQSQIDTIRGLGLKKIRISAEKSSAKPLPLSSSPPPATTQSMDDAAVAELAAKQARIAKLKERRSAIQKCEKQYLSATKTINSITKNLMAQPEETIKQAAELTHQLATSMLGEKEIAIHLMSDKSLGEEVYYHSLNVSVLVMMLARELGMKVIDLAALGMGAIFHDIGKSKIPHQVLIKADNPSKAEADFLRQHCAYGVEMAQKVGLSASVIKLIIQHHECIDGSGYPAGLKGEQIDPLAKLLAIVNAYDNLCNPVNVINAVTPHEALSMMYSKQRARFDSKMMGMFIHCLGVYPPGTIVVLNNDIYGMVMSVNPTKPLKPGVMIYDDSVPKDEAIIIDLAEDTEFTITKAVRPAQLPANVYEYLSPRSRQTYYFDSTASSNSNDGK